MERCAKRYGDVFTLRIRPHSPWVILSAPDDVKSLFTADAQTLSVGADETNPILEPLLGSRSMMLLNEPLHMTHRKFMLPAFHGERMGNYGTIMADVVREEIARWPADEPFTLWPRMQAITMEVVLRAVFGASGAERLGALRTQLMRLTAWLNDSRRLALLSAFGSSSLIRSRGFRAVMDPVQASVVEEIRRRRAGVTHDDDILSMLEQAYDESGAPITEPELRDELITLLSDGPTATSLAWAFERLLRHPDKLARVREESLAGEETYTNAVVKETLRLCPSAPLVVRRLREPMRFGEHTIPSGVLVAASVHLVHRREDIYPSPRAFLPERFLERPAGTYTWIPFGGGVRRCVAAGFAQLEMKEVIQTVLREVDLRPATADSERPARSAIAFAPGEEARVVVTRRDPAAPGMRAVAAQLA
jgi:cytochrome P450